MPSFEPELPPTNDTQTQILMDRQHAERLSRLASAEAAPKAPMTGPNGALVQGGVVTALVYGFNEPLSENATLVVGAEAWTETMPGEPLAWPRSERDRRLSETDFMDLPGWRASHVDRIAAADAYRQALRDMPDLQPDPAAIVWPDRPV